MDIEGTYAKVGGRCRGLSLLSGGLDSQLAVRVLQRAGAEVEAVCFSTPFFDCAAARRAAVALGVKLHVVDFLDDEIALIKNPPHGFGSAMNPCIDCHATMIRRAGEMMSRLGYDFVATGEVRGQRPMSQNAQALVTVEKASGLEGRLVRPLSARLLEPTIPERDGLLDRERLLDLSGRARDRQIALAAEFGIVEYPSPAGGCKLTEAGFSRKLRDLMEHEGLDDRRLVELTVVARRFRLPDGTSVLLGRDQRENAILQGEKGVVLYPVNTAGPTALLPRVRSDADLELAKGIVGAYSRHDRIGGDVELNLGIVPRPYDRERYRAYQVC